MTVVLVTQKPGAVSDEVVADVAARFGFELVDNEQLHQCGAERLQISERTLPSLLMGDASFIQRLTIGPHRLLRCLADELGALSARGNGRARSALVVEVAGNTIRLAPAMSSEEAIARVEQHLRGRSARTAASDQGPSVAMRWGPQGF